ncbi:MAG: GldM family protein [Phaeodactylibacter sp.]|uniref:type IX secretion system motor protein PorM/GldM n=1 Tax=Phaeodactylibacter sp. TaxID=1940289 RepID=UPI0032ECBECF
MSIPKEPRQLMINLMYLVLTALLALNVSAEVMNAFFTLDDGNKESIATVESQLEQTVSGLKSLLSDESKAKYRPIEPAVDQVRETISSFNSYVNTLRDNLIDEAGNQNGEVDDEDYTESYGKVVPKGKKNKDVTTRMLVDAGRGEELKAEILKTKEQLVKIYTDLLRNYGKDFGLKDPEIENRIKNIGNNLPFGIDDETWKESKDKQSWADFKFRQMPLAAVLPLMSQMQSNAKSSEAALINSMAELAGGRVVEFDSFFPVVQAEKAYVIKGDPFNAEISVGTYSSQINPNDINIYVNGSAVPVGEGGKAEYSTRTTSTGNKQLKLKVEVRNPLTGEVSEGESIYEYEVGTRSATVSADKMNVFYIGVDNPVSVSASGVSSNDLNVRASGCSIRALNRSDGKYMVTADRPGEAKIILAGGGLPSTTFDFRIKRIPDPVARLSKSSGGAMGNGEFKAQGGVGAFLDNFDFDAQCTIQGFTLVYVAARQDPVEVINAGARYNAASRRMVNQAKPGDIYYFDDVKARCPGDKVGRPINSMVFKIK